MDLDGLDYSQNAYETDVYDVEPDQRSQNDDYSYDGYEQSAASSELIEKYQQMLENPVIEEPLEELLESRIEQMRR